MLIGRIAIVLALVDGFGGDTDIAAAGERLQIKRRAVSYTHLDVYKRQAQCEGAPVYQILSQEL